MNLNAGRTPRVGSCSVPGRFLIGPWAVGGRGEARNDAVPQIVEHLRVEEADRLGPRRRPRVVIVGGGLTGLAAAHRLTSGGASGQALDVVVLESRDRRGGAIWTESRDGFLLEGGADSFITAKPWALDLCRELGLGDQIIPTDPGNRRSFVVRRGRLLPVPSGFVLMAPNRVVPLLTSPILSLKGKLRLLLDLVLPARTEGADESLASFVRRRLGREALDRLVQPLVGGIYTADPSELSVAATLPQFLEMEREHGGLIRGGLRKARRERAGGAQNGGESGARYGMFATLAGGMGTLPDALASSLPPGVLRLGAAVRRIARREAGGASSGVGRPWSVELRDGPAIEADAVVLATEAHAAARLVDGFDPSLALGLRSIPYASSAIVQLGYRRDQVAHPLDGFGAVVPLIEGRSILALSFTSVKFPGRAPAGSVLMRVFLGGATQPELFDQDDAWLIETAAREAAELLGITGPPSLTDVARHPRGMPQYTLGHLDRVSQVIEHAGRHAGLVLAGNYLGGVGVPDCVRSGRQAAESAVAALGARDSEAAA
jgi:oxygen-dependent protoporphyrinogen oxidase